ncbi:hairy-related 5 [Periophthalmus magnuspinnatus]|uniref:hairy-related 5 n=1 Tax=Periophthalmus magnuspinnatus TaxID=409849 RepID=UPI00145ACC89|nr:hairy-related 5 [Periophthalmus magnuspinnatus]
MRAVTPETQPKRTSRRSKIAKPVVEKRRRERINHSLETLRLLLLEKMDDERLKNPKVEKAEILESVVHFLQAEIQMKKAPRFGKKLHFEEEARQQNYQDGMRSCLRRVSSFIANKSQDSERQSPMNFSPMYISSGHLSPSAHLPSPGHFGRALLSSPSLSPSPSLGQTPVHYPVHSQTAARGYDITPQKLSSDTVWRPWPQ